MQAMTLNHMIDPLPMIHHGLNMSNSASGYFNAAPQYMTQIGVNGDSFYGGNGVFGGADMGLDGVPPLESISIEENVKTENMYNNRTMNNNTSNNLNNISNCSNYNNRAENLARVGNYWEGEEWDLEELMKDVPSFPLLDFQAE